MRKNIEFRWENSEFLRKFIPETRFTDIRWEFRNADGNVFIMKGYGAKTGVRGSKEMGKGKVDFKALFAVAKKAGLEDYYVEQEKYNMTPLEAIKYDYDFIMKAKYIKW